MARQSVALDHGPDDAGRRPRLSLITARQEGLEALAALVDLVEPAGEELAEED